MLSVNEVRLIGHIGGIVTHPSERQPLRFTLATQRQWKNQAGEAQEKTDWHRVTVWRPNDTLCAKAAKGARVYVAGSIRVTQYKDKAGTRRTSVEIEAPDARVEVLAPPKDDAAAAAPPPPDDDDGIPGIDY